MSAPSPSPKPDPLRQWLAWTGAGYSPDRRLPLGAPPSSGERLPAPALDRVLKTDLPLMYDEAAKLARGRDAQAKFVALQVGATTLDFAGIEPVTMGMLILVNVFFYSPLDDVVLEYRAMFDERGLYQKLALQPASSKLISWNVDDYEDAAQGAKYVSPSTPPDFKSVPGLREPWANSNLGKGLATAWALAGKPLHFDLVIRASARVPYDFSIQLYPDQKKEPQKPTTKMLVIGPDYYRDWAGLPP